MQEKIIKFLRENKTYVSGEEMSDVLQISRAAVWKYIDHLRQEGYNINAVPHLGYRLESVPDRLIPSEISFGLKTKVMGKRIFSYEVLSSTMDEAFELGMRHEPEGSIICAETQTKGRGRLGRKWVSPKGRGLYFSIILRPPFSLERMPQITLMAAVVLADALERVGNIETNIKWPNDVRVGAKKIAGILTETRAEQDQVKFLVLGMGININASQSQLVPEATSLKIETLRNYDRIVVLQEILLALEHWYGVLCQQGFGPILAEWKDRCKMLNKRVRISDGSGMVEGLALDVDHDGGLLVKLPQGQVVKKMAGDLIIP